MHTCVYILYVGAYSMCMYDMYICIRIYATYLCICFLVIVYMYLAVQDVCMHECMYLVFYACVCCMCVHIHVCVYTYMLHNCTNPDRASTRHPLLIELLSNVFFVFRGVQHRRYKRHRGLTRCKLEQTE